MARSRRPQPNAFVAAATKVKLEGSQEQIKRDLGRRADWQKPAWMFYDAVPEVKHALLYSGNAMAKMRLYVGTRPEGSDPNAPPIPVTDKASGIAPEVARRAEAELARLRSRLGGQAGILRGLQINLEAVGETYIVGFGERKAGERRARGIGQLQLGQPEQDEGEPEEWAVKSISEVESKDGKVVVKENEKDTNGITLDPERDTLFRVYQQHPRWSAMADCNLQGCLGTCETLLLLDRQVRAEARSRMNAGILLVPNELSFGPDEPAEDEDGDEAKNDPFLQELDEGLSDPAVDEDAKGTTVPLVVRGDSEHLEKMRWLSLGRGGDGTVEVRIDKHVQRLARGLNLPVEVVMGHMQTTFSNAEQVDQDTFEDYFQPRAELLVDALTVGFLRPQLLDGDDPVQEDVVDRLVVWYDPAALVGQPNTEAAADFGHQALLISDEAWRRVKGFSEDDAPDDAEVARREARKPTFSTDDQAAMARLLARYAAELPTPALAAAARRAPDDAGRRLVELDRELRTRLLVLADRTLSRALEKANNKIRTKATGTLRTELRNLSADLAALHAYTKLGPAGMTAAGLGDDDLLEGAFDAMEESFLAWGTRAQRQALDLASRVIGGLSTAQRDQLGLRQAADLQEAWSWTREALTGLATARLFDPRPEVGELGELTGERVPAGLVRQALARAGGAQGLETTGGGLGVVLTNGGQRPAGGIGTGQLVTDAMVEGGASVEGFRWVYGPALRSRPFEPHLELDGVEFSNFDDPVLANGDSFPLTAYYMPGDHDGCVCDFEPIIVPPGQ